MKLATFFALSTGLVLVLASGATTALADDDPIPPPDPNAQMSGAGGAMDGSGSGGAMDGSGAGGAMDGSGAGGAMDGSGSGGAMDGNASGGATGGMMAVGVWDPRLLTAPQTLPMSAIGAAATFQVLRLNITPEPPAMMSTVTAEYLALAAGYGVTEQITAGVTYALNIHDPGGSFPRDGRWKGPLGLYGAYNVLHADKMSVTVGGDIHTDLDNSDHIGFGFGASAKYLVTPEIAVFTGNPVPIGPAGDQLTISLADKGPIELHIPVGVALQATPELFAYLDTTLVDIAIVNANNRFFGSDILVFEAGGLFRVTPEIDVGVVLTDDLKDAGDAYIIGFTGRYYMH